METEAMGRVLTEATIENLQDLWEVKRGLRSANQVRRVVVPNALVDSGAISVSLPRRIIQQLGLDPVTVKNTLTAGGVRQTTLYEAVRLTIQERTCIAEVLEVPDNVPVLIGQIPLEFLDFVIDMKNRCLIGNPEHGGEQMLEMY